MNAIFNNLVSALTFSRKFFGLFSLSLFFGSVVNDFSLLVRTSEEFPNLGVAAIQPESIFRQDTRISSCLDQVANTPHLTDTNREMELSAMGIDAEEPNCLHVNFFVDSAGWIHFRLDVLFYQTENLKLDVRIEDTSGTVIFEGNNLLDTTMVSLNVCEYIFESLRAFVSSPGKNSCWSEMTFKAGSPKINGESLNVWCSDYILSDITAYLNLIGGKRADLICHEDAIETQYVVDWVGFPKSAHCTNDTIEIRYREFEAFGQFNLRGHAFDTLVVFRLPELTDSNLICPQQSIVYSDNVSDFKGPSLEVGSPVIDTTIINLIDVEMVDGDLSFTAKDLSDCGIQINMEQEKLVEGCSEEYEVGVNIQQICLTDSTTIFTGRCEFRVSLLDTLSSLMAIPQCIIAGPVESGDTVETKECNYDLEVKVNVTDPGGLKATALGVTSGIFGYVGKRVNRSGRRRAHR